MIRVKSQAAAQAIAQMHNILGMDSNPARFDWMRKAGEDDLLLHERRAEWLIEAGCSACYRADSWDELPRAVRGKLSGVEA